MSLSSFFSSFIPTVYADAPEDKEEEKPEAQEAEQEEEEEEEPEDTMPELQEQCKESAACAAATKHFAHCQEKVSAGEGFHGEDCVEEFMMHCVDNCVAPKLFAQLK
ncbi:hypothetical protein BDY19DRAFT_985993 [Irpex rosettiformis]|uniref:Uncharacterized protein n=1 Tax=Irpex rosettiformis TaxID=378272 RepID=A0ACB8TZS1_9APHY|nr:hypothetical protein BDY19DRAFT_985993 [Irpex rosettiformis]